MRWLSSRFAFNIFLLLCYNSVIKQNNYNMTPTLFELHKRIADIFSKAHKQNNNLGKIDPVRMQFSEIKTKIKDVYSLSSYNEERNDSDNSFIQRQIEENQRKIEKYTKRINEFADNFNISSEINDFLKDLKNLSFTYLDKFLDKKFEEVKAERSLKGYKKGLKGLFSEYRNEIYDFNKQNGKGFYDFMGQYTFGDTKTQQVMLEKIKRLKEHGFDIEIMQPENEKNNIVILTNSLNVEAIHDIAYQHCNISAKNIHGRFLCPNPNKPLEIEEVRGKYKRAPEIYLTNCRTDNKIPQVLQPYFYASVDGYGVNYGMPQMALLSHRVDKKHSGVKNAIHIIHRKNPLKEYPVYIRKQTGEKQTNQVTNSPSPSKPKNR